MFFLPGPHSVVQWGNWSISEQPDFARIDPAAVLKAGLEADIMWSPETTRMNSRHISITA